MHCNSIPGPCFGTAGGPGPWLQCDLVRYGCSLAARLPDAGALQAGCCAGGRLRSGRGAPQREHRHRQTSPLSRLGPYVKNDSSSCYMVLSCGACPATQDERDTKGQSLILVSITACHACQQLVKSGAQDAACRGRVVLQNDLPTQQCGLLPKQQLPGDVHWDDWCVQA